MKEEVKVKAKAKKNEASMYYTDDDSDDDFQPTKRKKVRNLPLKIYDHLWLWLTFIVSFKQMSTSPAENLKPTTTPVKQPKQEPPELASFVGSCASDFKKSDEFTVTPSAAAHTATVAADYDAASNTERPLLQKQRYRSYICKAFCQSGGGGGISPPLSTELEIVSSFFSSPLSLLLLLLFSLSVYAYFFGFACFQDSENLFWNSHTQADRSSGKGIQAHRLLPYAVSFPDYAAYNILDVEIMTLSARSGDTEQFFSSYFSFLTSYFMFLFLYFFLLLNAQHAG